MVRNGQDILVWLDPWIPSISGFSISGFKPFPLYPDQNRVFLKVADLIDESTGQWNRSLIWATFSQPHAEAIVKIHLSLNTKRDELTWVPKNSGGFSIKSMYREIIKLKMGLISRLDCSWWKKVWRMKVHERFKISLWKLL